MAAEQSHDLIVQVTVIPRLQVLVRIGGPTAVALVRFVDILDATGVWLSCLPECFLQSVSGMMLGDQGSLSGVMCDLIDALLPLILGRAVGFVIENVYMSADGDMDNKSGLV